MQNKVEYSIQLFGNLTIKIRTQYPGTGCAFFLGAGKSAPSSTKYCKWNSVITFPHAPCPVLDPPSLFLTVQCHVLGLAFSSLRETSTAGRIPWPRLEPWHTQQKVTWKRTKIREWERNGEERKGGAGKWGREGERGRGGKRKEKRECPLVVNWKYANHDIADQENFAWINFHRLNFYIV